MRFQKVRMLVDRCETAIRQENLQISTQDRKPCEVIDSTPGVNKYINVNTPLQLGGLASYDFKVPADITRDKFDGCMKNLVHNGEVKYFLKKKFPLSNALSPRLNS